MLSPFCITLFLFLTFLKIFPSFLHIWFKYGNVVISDYVQVKEQEVISLASRSRVS